MFLQIAQFLGRGWLLWAATLVVQAPLAAASLRLTVAPTNTSARFGQTVIFTARAEGDAAVAYQWQTNGVDLPGATNPELLLANAQLRDGLAYRARITSGTETLETATVSLQFLHPADTDPADLRITEAELTAYVTQWRHGETPRFGPSPIPKEYVSRAAFLQNLGETYVFRATNGSAPLCWTPSETNASGETGANSFALGIASAAAGEIDSNTLLVKGLASPTTIQVTNGAVAIVNGTNMGPNAIVRNGDQLRLRYTGTISNGNQLVGIASGPLARGWRLLARTPRPLPPAPSGVVPGVIEGRFNVTESGAATYSIPLVVPSGVAGLTPQLSLNYSSQGSEGMLGVGWSLGGLSAITRAPKTIESDGLRGSVSLDNHDRFILDGQPLIVVRGSNGATGAEYRTRRESFQKIVSFGQAGDEDAGPEYFQVWTKSGLILEFGRTADSRLMANTDEPGGVMMWALNKVTDTSLSGNSYTLTYLKPEARVPFGAAGAPRQTGAQYLQRIEYARGRAKVEFTYSDLGETSVDYSIRYVAGAYVWQNRLLANVTSYFDGQRVRAYDLTYTRQGLTGRNFITRVVERGFTDTDVHHPTDFTYNTDTPVDSSGQEKVKLAFYNSEAPVRSEDKSFRVNGRVLDASDAGHSNERTENMGRIKFADFNGDGRPDLFHVRGKRGDLNECHAYLNQGNGAFKLVVGPRLKVKIPDPDDPQEDDADHLSRVQFGDFNGDGKTDLFVFKEKNQAAPHQIFYSTGTNFVPAPFVSANVGDILVDEGPWFSTLISAVKFADFDGDGRTDIYVIRERKLPNGERNDDDLFLNMGGGQFQKLPGIPSRMRLHLDADRRDLSGELRASATDISRYKIADFNGDGKADIYVVDGYDKSNVTGALYLFQDHYLGAETPWKHSAGITANIRDFDEAITDINSIMVGDFNGDGMADLLQLRRNENAPAEALIHFARGDGSWTAAVNTGLSFRLRKELTLGQIDLGRVKLADLNGDGRTDIYYVRGKGPDGVFDEIFLSKGNGKFTPAVRGVKTRVRDVLSVDRVLANGYSPGAEIPDDEGKTDVQAIFLLDFNGDGRADIGQFDDGFHLRLRHQKLQYPELLTQITDGHGQRTRIDYSSLTEIEPVEENTDGRHGFNPARPDFYQINDAGEAPLQYPLLYFHAPIFLVAKVGVLNGVGGTNHVTYRYRNGMLNVLGGGFQGFKEFIARDETTGRESTVEFPHQAFPAAHLLPGRFTTLAGFTPFAGIPIRTTQRIPRAGAASPLETIVISETVNSLGLWQYHKRFFPFVATATNRVFEPTDFTGPNSTPPPLKTTVTTTTYGRIGPVAGLPQGVPGAMPLSHDAFYGNASTLVVEEYEGEAIGEPRYRTSITNAYQDSVAKWHLGRLTRTVVEKSDTVSGAPSQTRTSAFTYDSTTGLLDLEILEPEDANGLRHEKGYSRDPQGNILVSYQGIAGEPLRRLITEFDPTGRLITRTINALGHAESQTLDPRLGLKLTHTGPNGLITRWTHDGFGRQLTETKADGTITRVSYRLYRNTTDAPDGPNPAQDGLFAVYFVQTDSTAGNTARVFFDLLGREVRRTSTALDGRRVVVDSHYNARGELFKKSEPYFLGDPARLYTEHEYDEAGRLIKTTAPGQRSSGVAYARVAPGILEKRHLNPLLQSRVVWENIRGQAIRSIDHLGQAAVYDYDPYGNQTRVTDPVGNATVLAYNQRGFKVSHTDPDAGSATLRYNGFGELVYQRDAKGAEVSMRYDALGRVIERTEPEGVTTWTYDAAPRGVGKPHSVVFRATDLSTPYVARYRYDALGLPAETIESLAVNGTVETYASAIHYDEESRPAVVVYPSGFAVRLTYGLRGHQVAVQDAATDAYFWRALSQTARGQLELTQLGETLLSRTVFNPATGLPLVIQAHTLNGGGFHAPNLQDLSFGFDELGNLRYREDRLGGSGLREDFTYDNLNRLKSWQVGSTLKTVDYSGLGNITFKSDVGNYAYAADHPHAVRTVSGLGYTYVYDANGNRVQTLAGSAEVQSLAYGSHNLPVTIASPTNRLEFAYAPDRHRYSQRVVSSAGVVITTKVYAGAGYEREYLPGEVKDTHYIFAGGQAVAVHLMSQRPAGMTRRTSYLLRDHIGSLQTIVDAGESFTRLAYDPWGRRRDPSTWQDLLPDARPAVDRGFTGHEHLEEVELIHMNGRVYDPVIGCFLSPDPMVQEPLDLQNLNRYSYILNNPLSYTDPSGYFFQWLFTKLFGETIGKIYGFFENIAIMIATGGPGSPLYAAVSAASAQMEAFAGTLMNGGSFGDAYLAGLKAGGLSLLKSKMGEAIGDMPSDTITDYLTKVAASGISEGTQEKLAGGKFTHGLIHGSINEAGGTYVDSIDSASLGSHDKQLLKLVSNSIASGTASKATGGQFCNGALTAAYEDIINGLAYNIAYAATVPWGKLERAAKDGAKNQGVELSGAAGFTLEAFFAQVIQGPSASAAGGGIKAQFLEVEIVLRDHLKYWGGGKLYDDKDNARFIKHDTETYYAANPQIMSGYSKPQAHINLARTMGLHPADMSLWLLFSIMGNSCEECKNAQ